MPKTFRETVNEAKARIREIDANGLADQSGPLAGREDVLIVDVRDMDDYEAGHIPGAVSIPRGVLEMNIDEHTTDEDRPIVLYCGGGSRSALSALSLQEMGYKNALSLSGGFKGWSGEGRPIESKE
jgi:rhodanese-related sulfurtransferase